MANKYRRKALRGAEEATCDLLAEVSTSERWAELLKAPLELAALQGNRSLAQKLVGAGAEVGNALHKATLGGHGDVVNDLLGNGASVAAKDANEKSPLHVAAYTGKTEMVQLLLLKGADKDALDNDECTPLYLAVFRGHVATALALLAAGADISLRCSSLKMSVVHVAAQRGHVETLLNAFIKHGADVDAVSTHQVTPLHLAAVHNGVEAIDVLVEAGANVEARNIVGSTPLHSAASRPSLEPCWPS